MKQRNIFNVQENIFQKESGFQNLKTPQRHAMKIKTVLAYMMSVAMEVVFIYVSTKKDGAN